MPKFKKPNDEIPRKRPDRQDGQKGGRTDKRIDGRAEILTGIYRNLTATTGSPIATFQQPFYKTNISRYINVGKRKQKFYNKNFADSNIRNSYVYLTVKSWTCYYVFNLL